MEPSCERPTVEQVGYRRKADHQRCCEAFLLLTPTPALRLDTTASSFEPSMADLLGQWRRKAKDLLCAGFLFTAPVLELWWVTMGPYCARPTAAQHGCCRIAEREFLCIASVLLMRILEPPWASRGFF